MKEPSLSDRALVVLVPDPVGRAVDKWRRLYDPNYDTVPAHITVAYPPFVPEQEWPAIRPLFAECLAQFAPFDVELRELGIFAATAHVLWFRPGDDGSLSRIHTALAQLFPQHFPAQPFEYTPHLTLGTFESEEQLLAARQAIEAQWKPRRFRVDHLLYMSATSHRAWCSCGQLPLGRPLRNL